MLDIGLGELVVMALLALLVFGPDRLPKVAADAARTLRQVRQMASTARRDLADAAGIETDPELAQAVRDLRDLDPRRVLTPMDDAESPSPSRRGASGSSAARPARGGGPSEGAGAVPGAAAGGPVEPARGTSAPGTPGPSGPEGTASTAVDPDWT